jgi:hypothetical protein
MQMQQIKTYLELCDSLACTSVQATNEGMTLGSIQYVGVLKNILLLNYEPMSQQVVLFKLGYIWV